MTPAQSTSIVRPRLVLDARGEVVRAGVVAHEPAELRVLVEPLAAGVALGVASPLERQRHLRDPGELVAHPLVVRLEVPLAPPGAPVLEQRRDVGVGHSLELGGADARLAHPGGALRHGGLAAPQRARDAVPAHPPSPDAA